MTHHPAGFAANSKPPADGGRSRRRPGIRFCPLAALALLAALLPGCTAEDPPPAATVAPPPTAAAPYDASQVPETADGAVLAVMEGFKHNQPEVLWHFLPASYQTDVNEVVHQFAHRMDGELWSKSVALLEKLARVLRAQQGLLEEAATPPAGRPGMAVGGAPPDWNALLGLLETLLRSDLADLEKLKTADAGRFLALTGSQLLSVMHLEDALDWKVRLESSEQDAALVLIEPPGQEPREHRFTRVEGKWIPRDLADNWPEAIGQAKARLMLLSPDNLRDIKPQWLETLASLDGALDQLGAARNKDQFGTALQGLIFPVIMLAGSMSNLPVAEDPAADTEEPGPTSAGPTSQNLVTVVIAGRLDDGARLSIQEKLEALTGVERPFSENIGDDEMTSFQIGPVTDLDAFAGALDFLEDVEVDANTRTITARPRR